MARHEPRNSKVAELRPCNGGFHNVGFDSSTYLPHNALLRRLLACAPPFSSFLSNFPLFFSLPNRTPREKDAARRPLRRLSSRDAGRSGEMRITSLGSWKAQHPCGCKASIHVNSPRSSYVTRDPLRSE
jgi:hypothetical protein